MQEIPCKEPIDVSAIGKEVLANLLKYVINRGKDSVKLRLVDSAGEGIPCTCCVDSFYYLKDRKGFYWILIMFYGTGDTLVQWEGLTKKQWLTLMMHLSLGMVQNLKRCDELGYFSSVCRIKYLLDLKMLT